MARETWKIDLQHSGIHFWIRHMVIAKVHGRFTKWEGTLTLDGDDLSRGSVDVKIDTSSIDTNEPDRDKHLRSADFFDVEKNPAITFQSKRVEKVSDDRYNVVGELTIHGVTKEVVLDAELAGKRTDPWGNERIGLSAKTSLTRSDYGLKWNQVLEAGGVLVGDKLEVQIEVEAVKQK